jgi:peroxiredoxin
MALLHTPAAALGSPAPAFTLKDAGGQPVSLDDVRGEHGTLVAFICNHCPYVKAIVDEFVADARILQAEGVGVVAVMPNDYRRYPDDAPARMTEFAARHGFTFPYLVDETQAVAREYGAVCTPDFFGYDRELKLVYRGRLDDRRGPGGNPATRRELLEAMRSAVAGNPAPGEQIPSMGCSIKWRD